VPDRRYMTIADIRRMADFARARSLAQRGLAAAARSVVAQYGDDVPQIVAEIGVDVPQRRS